MIKNSLNKYFGKKTFTRNELFEFYLQNEPGLNSNTFAWRIYHLKKNGIIKEIGRGLYSIYDKNKYSLQLNKNLEKTAHNISKTFTDITFCISESNWINEFSNHQFSNIFTIIEIEKDYLESVFFNLKKSTNNIFLKPNETEMERYISDVDNAIILIPLITRAPIQKSKNGKYYIPTLEKLLIDIYIKNSPYFFLTDSEIETSLINALTKYNINQTTLLAYAERRGKKKNILEFLKENNLLEVADD